MLTYFILILDNIITASAILCFIFFTSTAVMCGLYFGERIKSVKSFLILSTILFIFFTIIITFTPTTKQAALIFLSGQEDVVATAKNLPKLTKLGTDYLIELLEENKDVNKH